LKKKSFETENLFGFLKDVKLQLEMLQQFSLLEINQKGFFYNKSEKTL